MCVDLNLLREKIKAKDMNISDFSAEIGINPSTFYRKAEKGGETFTVGQIHKTGEVLDLTPEELSSIFLFSNSQ